MARRLGKHLPGRSTILQRIPYPPARICGRSLGYLLARDQTSLYEARTTGRDCDGRKLFHLTQGTQACHLSGLEFYVA